jgi:hypothetical protein
VLFLLAVLLFFSYFDSVAQYALDSASSSIPGRLRVKRFSPTLKGVELEGVRWDLGDKDPFFVADRVDVTIDHAALLRRDWLVLVSYAKVIRPGLRVTVDAQGDLNLLRLLDSEDPQSTDIRDLRMVVEFQDGWILYNDRREAGFLYELSDWNGTAALPDGKNLLLKTQAHRKDDESRFAFEGEVSLDRPKVSLTADLTQVDLLPFAGFPGFGPGLTLVQGNVNGSAVVQGGAEQWKDVLPSLFVVGKLDMADGLLAAPWLPVDLKDLNGSVALLGRRVSTSGFVGKAADIPFKVEGEADLDLAGDMSAKVGLARFSLDQLKPYLQDPPEVKGQAEVDLEIEGPIADPNVSGTAKGYNLSFQGQTVASARAKFLKLKNLVHFHEVVAQTAAGKVNGEGWLFLGQTPRVLIALNGSNTNPDALMPDLAQSADFNVRVLGEVDDPVMFGQGQLRGLGSWAQGASSAGGSFYLKGRDLMLIDGLALKGGSSVRVPVAAVNMDSRQIDGIVSTEGFSMTDVPGLVGVSGQVSGQATFSADLSGPTPRIVAQGNLTNGSFATGGYQADDASGAFSFDGYQMIIPDANATFEGSRVNLSGVYDLRDQAVAFSARSDSLDLGAFGLPGESAAVIGSVSGQLGGQLGVYGYASSGRGRAALSAFQRANGTVGGVAWVDGAIPGQKDSSVLATVVGDGTLSRLNLEYTGTAESPLLSSHLGPLDIYGGALLANRVLNIRPTLVTARTDDAPQPLSFVTYSGAAYPFFGPLLAGPLERIVVEEQGVPTSRSLSLSGQANLANQNLNLQFHLRSANLEELAEQPLGSDPDGSSINEALPFDVISGFGSVRGAITGTFGAPKLQADYALPWLLLANGYENRQSLSSKGRFSLSGRTLKVGSAAVSEQPYDPRLSSNSAALFELASQLSGLLAAKGTIEGDGRFDLRLATAGFNASFLSLVAPSTYRRYLPYGRLATENLHVWGSAASPSLAGAVRLVQGGVFLAGEGFPFQTASLNFSSQGGETRIEDLVLEAPGLNVTGYGKRSSSGELSGQLSAREVDLEELHRFGPPLSGLSGQVDAIVGIAGKLPRQPRIEVAAVGRNLTWNPAAVGGLAGTLPIEELALGHFTPDGKGLLSGMSVTASEDGLSLKLPEQGLRFRTAEGGLSLEAEGSVRFPGGLPDMRMFKTFSDWGRYFASPSGPDFGRPGTPFQAQAQNWTFAEISRLLGRDDIPYKASGTAALALEGQWWRDHKRESSGSLPLYSLSLEALRFEGDREGIASGFELREPARLAYQREGEAGFLNLQGLNLGFFGQEATLAKTPAEGQPPAEPAFSRRGSLQAEAKLALTQMPEAKPNSTLNLGAVDIPLENLAFLLPEAINLGGLVESLEVNLDGLLPSPRLGVAALLTDLSLGPLREMRLQGQLTGALQQDGGYQLSLGDVADPAVTLSFGASDAADHQMKAEGNATLRWVRATPLDPSRLSLFANGLDVSPDSPLDLSAQVLDKSLLVLADAVPGQDEARGDLSASLSVSGTLGYPEFEGQAKLADGSFRSQSFGDFENLQLDANVERITREEAEPSEVLQALSSGFITRFSLPKFEGTLGKKPFFAAGQAEFAGISPTFLKMLFVGEALPLKVPNLFTGTADVDMELRGRISRDNNVPTLSPVVLGTVVIPSGDFDVPTSAVNGNGKGFGLPIDYDVTIDLGQEFYVHMFGSEVRAVGELRLISQDGQPELYGRTELSRGQVRIPFYDASFRVRQGVAYFEGPMIPRLEAVEAVADLGGYRIVARVDGVYPDALNVNLFSDPPLPQSELSRLVVLGGLPGQFSGINDPNQSGSSLSALSGGGVSFLSGMLTNRLTEKIGRIFLLSEVSFDYIPPASYVIKLAKALDPNDTFLLTLTRVIRDNGLNESLYGVEWRMSQTVLTRVALDQFNRARFWLQSINRF